MDLKCFLDLFADDSTVSDSSSNIKSFIESLSVDLDLISNWLFHNRLVINWLKSQAVLFNYIFIESNPSFINSGHLDLSLGTVSLIRQRYWECYWMID